MRSASSPVAIGGYCADDGRGVKPGSSAPSDLTSHHHLAQRESGAVRVRPELQIRRLGGQLGGKRKGLAAPGAGEVNRGHLSGSVLLSIVVADHFEIGDRAAGWRLEPEVEVEVIAPGGHDYPGAAHPTVAARDKVKHRAATTDAGITLHRARIPDVQEHRGERSYDPRSIVAVPGDERLELRLRSSRVAALEEDQREPVVPDTVTLVGEQPGDPTLAVLAAGQGGQVKQMKHRVAVVGEPERRIEVAVEREVQREKVLAAMRKRGRQAVGHGQRGLGADDAM